MHDVLGVEIIDSLEGLEEELIDLGHTWMASMCHLQGSVFEKAPIGRIFHDHVDIGVVL